METMHRYKLFLPRDYIKWLDQFCIVLLNSWTFYSDCFGVGWGSKENTVLEKHYISPNSWQRVIEIKNIFFVLLLSLSNSKILPISKNWFFKIKEVIVCPFHMNCRILPQSQLILHMTDTTFIGVFHLKSLWKFLGKRT